MTTVMSDLSTFGQSGDGMKKTRPEMPDLSSFDQSGNGMKENNEASPLLELM